MKIDLHKIVADFGGAHALAQSLSALRPEKSLSPAAVYKWLARGTLPAAYFESLARLAEIRGCAFNLNDYWQEEESRIAVSPIRFYDASLTGCHHVLGLPVDLRSKLLIARKLEQLGVDTIEAGSIEVDGSDVGAVFDEVDAIAAVLRRAQVCLSLPFNARLMEMAATRLARLGTETARLCITVGPDRWRQGTRRRLNHLRRSIEKAQGLPIAIEVAFEDATVYEPVLAEWIDGCIRSGARTITVRDEQGGQLPEAFGALIRALRVRTENGAQAVWSVRCNNDLGLASAAALAAVRAGAREIQCAIGGVGRRAGLAPLEEVAMALRAHRAVFSSQDRIDTRQIGPTARLVATLTGQPIDIGKPLIGDNVFEPSLSADPAQPETRLVDPVEVGWGEPQTEIGHLSGRSAFKSKLEALGIDLGGEENLSRAFFRFKELARKKRVLYDEDIFALAFSAGDDHGPYRLVASKVVGETGEDPYARIVLRRDDRETSAEATGSGTIDALFCALEKIVTSGSELVSYSVSAVTRGSDSQAKVTVRLKHAGCLYCGQASDIDTVTASAEAYLAAVNPILALAHH